MQQFAALREKARAGDKENERFVADLLANGGHLSGPEKPEQPSEWDVPLYKAGPPARTSEPKLGDTEDERAYYKAVASHKRGDDALAEHLERKSAKAKRARTHEQGSVDGVAVSSRNVEFNSRLK